MKKRKSIEEQVSKFQELDKASFSVDQKLDELISLLEQSALDSKTVVQLQDKFNKAIENTRLSREDLDEFRKLDDVQMSRMEIADDLEGLLTKYKLDSRETTNYAINKPAKIVQFVIAVLLIALGFAMIILPAPPYFEMFTIFYFTTNDGVTLMDIISLLIIFTGVYLLFISISKLTARK